MAIAARSSLLHLTKTEFETLLNTSAATGGTILVAEMICFVAQKALTDLLATSSFNRTAVLGIGIATVLATRWIKNRQLIDEHAMDVGVLTGLFVSYQVTFLALPLITSIFGGAAAGAVVAGSLVARAARRRETR